MQDPSLVVRELITELRDEMSDAARELRNRANWDLQCPVVVIDARTRPRRVLKTSVGGLTGAITTSNIIDSPLLRTFLMRCREIGSEEALDEFMHGPDAEQFAIATFGIYLGFAIGPGADKHSYDAPLYK